MNAAVITVLVLLLIVFGMVAVFFMMRPKNVSTSEEEETTSQEEETIVIGGKETYISMPSAEQVPMSFSEYPVYVYDRDSTRLNSAEFWDKNKECPGGGFDCLYSEKVVDGRVVAITDKDGNNFIQQFVDDLYAGKLPLIDEMLEEKETFLKRNKLSKDNKLMRKVGQEWKVVTPNLEETTASKGGGLSNFMMPVGQYLLITMLLYKMTGKPKPKVVIDLPAKKRKAPLPSVSVSAP